MTTHPLRPLQPLHLCAGTGPVTPAPTGTEGLGFRRESLRLSALRARYAAPVALYLFVPLALLLWIAAIPALGSAAASSKPGTLTIPAQVTSCPTSGQLSGQCEITFRPAGYGGREVRTQLAQSGVLGVELGDNLTVWFPDGHGQVAGTPALAGWRAWAQGMTLLAAAAGVTALTALLLVSERTGLSRAWR